MVAPIFTFLLALLLTILVFDPDFVVSENGGAQPSQSECVNCNICPYPCQLPPTNPGYPIYVAPPPPPPPSASENPPEVTSPPPPLAQVNCPPVPVQCCGQQPPPNANYPPNPIPNQNQNPYTYIPPAEDNHSALPCPASSFFSVPILIFCAALLL